MTDWTDDDLGELLRDGLRTDVPDGLTDRLADLGAWVDPDAVLAEWTVETASVRADGSDVLSCRWGDELQVTVSEVRGRERSELTVAVDGDHAGRVTCRIEVLGIDPAPVALTDGIGRATIPAGGRYRLVFETGDARYATDWID